MPVYEDLSFAQHQIHEKDVLLREYYRVLMGNNRCGGNRSKTNGKEKFYRNQ